MDIEKIETRGGAPVTQQAGLDVLQRQRSFEQRVVLQIDLPHGKIIRRAPIGVHLVEQIGR